MKFQVEGQEFAKILRSEQFLVAEFVPGGFSDVID